MPDREVQSTLTADWWEWENQSFSAGIAEALFASWAHDTHPDDHVLWYTNRAPWDVRSDSLSVDVKDSFISTVRYGPNGEHEECLGFMGTKRGAGAEAREDVTHYALVVRNRDDGADTIRVNQDGTLTITAVASFRIYLVPRDVINTFTPERTTTGKIGNGRNRFLPLPEAAEYLVFDNRRQHDPTLAAVANINGKECEPLLAAHHPAQQN